MSDYIDAPLLLVSMRPTRRERFLESLSHFAFRVKANEVGFKADEAKLRLQRRRAEARWL